MPTVPVVVPLKRKKNKGKNRTQIRKVAIEKARVAFTIHLHKRDAINLAKAIQAAWPEATLSK